MRGYFDIGTDARDIQRSEPVTPYTKVIINVATEETDLESGDVVLSYEAGDDTGLTLELDCPWGTQAMADNILAQIRGYQYQPFTAEDALLDPAMELGDGVGANGVRSGIYRQDSEFGGTFYSNVEAPQDEQLDHEYQYESSTERKITRQKNATKAMFAVHENEISAKVSQEGGDPTSFGWALTPTEFRLASGSKLVFVCNQYGITVNGTIQATSGFFGATADRGFTIGSNAIYNPPSKSSMGAEVAGVYIGTDGINIGNGAFRVDAAGNGWFEGTVYASSMEGQIVNGQIGYGAVEGGGGGGNGKIKGGTVSKGDTNHGSEVTHGESAYNAVSGIINGTTNFTKVQTDGIWVGTNGVTMDNTPMKRIMVTIGTRSYYVIGASI